VCDLTDSELAALESISSDLHTTPTTTNLSVAFYLISFAMFVVFSILCAISNNIIMLIVFRLCSGATSASVQAVGAGTIADIWESFERGRAMGIFYLGPLLGPLFAPIIGGALAQELGWQATMWFLAIYGLVVELCILLFLPETLAKKKKDELPSGDDGTAELQQTNTRQSVKVKSKKMVRHLKRYLLDPFKVIYFLRFPPVLITVLIAAEAFGALYIVNIALQQKYAESPYRFSELIIGLTYMAPGLGYMVASILGGRWIDSIMAREARKANRYDDKGKLIYLPEDRMRENMWLAHAVYPLSLLGFGWSLRYGVFWFVPELFLFFFGVASMLVFVSNNPPAPEAWSFYKKKYSC
jgi:predicted MFS family arabinose efflux permease